MDIHDREVDSNCRSVAWNFGVSAVLLLIRSLTSKKGNTIVILHSNDNKFRELSFLSQRSGAGVSRLRDDPEEGQRQVHRGKEKEDNMKPEIMDETCRPQISAL